MTAAATAAAAVGCSWWLGAVLEEEDQEGWMGSTVFTLSLIC